MEILNCTMGMYIQRQIDKEFDDYEKEYNKYLKKERKREKKRIAEKRAHKEAMMIKQYEMEQENIRLIGEVLKEVICEVYDMMNNKEE